MSDVETINVAVHFESDGSSSEKGLFVFHVDDGDVFEYVQVNFTGMHLIGGSAA